MAERFKRLFHNDERVYYVGSPLVIEAVALLEDTKENKIIGQAKIKSISPKVIKAVFTTVFIFNVLNESIGECRHEYLDLAVRRDEEFGQQVAVLIDNNGARVASLRIDKVLFDDGSIWNNDGAEKITINAAGLLKDTLGDNRAVEEYKRIYGPRMLYVPEQIRDIWRCSCGTINRIEEEACHGCNNNRQVLMGNLDKDSLVSAAIENKYSKAISQLNEANDEQSYNRAARIFEELGDYKDSEEKKKYCLEQEESSRKDAIYQKALNDINSISIGDIESALYSLRKIGDWKESQAVIAEGERRIESIRKSRDKAKRRKRLIVAFCISIALLSVGFYVANWHVIPMIRYNMAEKALANEEFDSAYTIYVKLGGYRDCSDKAIETLYKKASYLESQEQYSEAAFEYEKIPDYQDSKLKAEHCKLEAKYRDAIALYDSKDFDSAIVAFTDLGDYADSKEWILKSQYAQACDYFDSKDYEKSEELFFKLGGYEDSKERVKESKYQRADVLYENKDYKSAYELFEKLGAYKDAADRRDDAKYIYACEKLKAKKYKEASSLFVKLKNYKKGKEKYNIATYAYAKKCYDSKKYAEASTYFFAVKGYKDAETLGNESCYKVGVDYLESKKYELAVRYLEKISGYSDAKTKVSAAKYGYVKEHKNNKDRTTYKYLKTLKADGYLDSSAIFKELYAWKLVVTAVNSSWSGTVNQTSISKYSAVIFHYKLTGGEPGGETTITVKFRTPEHSGSYVFDSPDGRGYTGAYGWENGIYQKPQYGKTGTLTCVFYDSDGNKIGEGSVKITE